MQSVTLPGDAEETETWMESGKALAHVIKLLPTNNTSYYVKLVVRVITYATNRTKK